MSQYYRFMIGHCLGRTGAAAGGEGRGSSAVCRGVKPTRQSSGCLKGNASPLSIAAISKSGNDPLHNITMPQCHKQHTQHAVDAVERSVQHATAGWLKQQLSVVGTAPCSKLCTCHIQYHHKYTSGSNRY